MSAQLKGIEENLKFMVLEVSRQIEDARKILVDSRSDIVAKIDPRDDYIDNLKNIIESKCFDFSARSRAQADYIRAIDVIANNLEKIGDYVVTIVKQTTFLTKPEFSRRYDFRLFFKEIFLALRLIDASVVRRDMDGALKICRSEVKLDEIYKKLWDEIIADLKEGGEDAQNCVTCLLIAGNLERVGDALLNIGEAIMSSVLGEKLKIHQFESFQGAVESANIKIAPAKMPFKAMGETKSGCVIDRVQTESVGVDNGQGIIFKEGAIRKILKEKENIERWERIFPGLPPRVFGFHQSGQSGSLLLEFLRGGNLRDIIITGKNDLLKEAVAALKETVGNVWTKTRDPHPVSANYMGQMASRIEDVYTVHPAFKSAQMEVLGDLEIPTFADLANQAKMLESELKAPFGVLIHGDFNIDNLMYDMDLKKVHYIDLYRSCSSDYLQDVSVFLISNFRTPVFEPTLRRKLNWVAMEFYEFAADFASRQNDETFQARLALGLARSLITSTRFGFNEDFARVMYLRAVYLLEKFNAHQGKPWSEFKVPEDAFIY